MTKKNLIRAAVSLILISVQIGVYLGIVADDPLHLLRPDPKCAICQVTSALAIKNSSQMIPNPCPQIIYGIDLSLNTQHFPVLVRSLSIRAPPFIPSAA